MTTAQSKSKRTRMTYARYIASLTNTKLQELAEKKPGLARACTIAMAGASSLCWNHHILAIAEAIR